MMTCAAPPPRQRRSQKLTCCRQETLLNLFVGCTACRRPHFPFCCARATCLPACASAAKSQHLACLLLAGLRRSCCFAADTPLLCAPRPPSAWRASRRSLRAPCTRPPSPGAGAPMRCAATRRRMCRTCWGAALKAASKARPKVRSHSPCQTCLCISASFYSAHTCERQPKQAAQHFPCAFFCCWLTLELSSLIDTDGTS